MNINIMKVKKYPLSPWHVVSALCLLLTPGVHSQETVTWSGGSTNINFGTASNYTPVPASMAAAILVFDTETSPNMRITGASNIGGFIVKAGGSGFTLNSSSTNMHPLLVKEAGISVEASAIATLMVPLSRHSSAEAINIQVGSNGRLNLYNVMNPVTKPLYKTGTGTLYFGASSGDVRNGSSFNFHQGIIELGSGVTIGYGTNSPGTAGELPVYLGSTTTSTTLQGAGNIDGRLITHGAANSIINATQGTLGITNLNAQTGASFVFDLATSYRVEGTGSFSGENLMFNFSGGTTGVAYTLFEYGAYDVDTSTFQIASENYMLDTSFGDGGWLIDNGALQVQFVNVIPEPSTFLLVSISLLGCTFFTRRSHEKIS